MPVGKPAHTYTHSQEQAAQTIHKIVERACYGDDAFALAQLRWSGAIIEEIPIGARKPIIYRYQVEKVYRDDLMRVLAEAHLVEG